MARPKKYFFFFKQKCLKIAQYGEKNWWQFFFFWPYIHPSEYWLATLAWYKGNFCVTFLGTPPPDRPQWENLMFFHHLFPPTFCADQFSPSERNWKKIENMLFSIIESCSERCCCREHLPWLSFERENLSYYFCTSKNPSLSLHPVKIEFLRFFESWIRPKNNFFFCEKTNVS